MFPNLFYGENPLKIGEFSPTKDVNEPRISKGCWTMMFRKSKEVGGTLGCDFRAGGKICWWVNSMIASWEDGPGGGGHW